MYVVLEAVRQHESEDEKFKVGENADCNSCWNRCAGMMMKGELEGARIVSRAGTGALARMTCWIWKEMRIVSRAGIGALG